MFLDRQYRHRDGLANRVLASWFSILLAITVGLLVGATGLLASNTGRLAISWFGVGILFIVGILVTAIRPHWTTIALACVGWITYGTPAITSGGSGVAKGLYVGEGLVVLLLAGALVPLIREWKRTTIPKTTLGLFGMFLVISLWSVLHNVWFPDLLVEQNGTYPHFVIVNIVEILLRVFAFGVFLIGNYLAQTRHRNAVLISVVAGGVLSLVTLLTPWFDLAPSFSVFGRAIGVGLAVVVTLSSRFPAWLRALGLLLVVTCVVVSGFLGAEWVSGLVAMSVSIMLVVYHRSRLVFWWLVVALGLMLVFRTDYIVERVYNPNFYAGGRMNWGVATLGGRSPGILENDRSRMLVAAVRYANTFPLGVGPGNYRQVNQYYGRKNVWNTTQFSSAHGTYAQALSETGWAGLACLLLLLGNILSVMWKNSRTDTYGVGLAAGCTAVVVASFLGDYLFPTYYNGGLAHFGSTIIFWLCAGIGCAIKEKSVLETE